MAPEIRPDCEFHPDIRPGRFTEEDPARRKGKTRKNHRRGRKMPKRPAGFVEIKGLRESCTGCPNYQICEYPCDYMERRHLPARELSRPDYSEAWRRTRTQYVLDHEDVIIDKRWRRIVRLYFRNGLPLGKIARLLRVGESTLDEDIRRIVSYCWKLDKWHNRIRCIRFSLGLTDEGE